MVLPNHSEVMVDVLRLHRVLACQTRCFSYNLVNM